MRNEDVLKRAKIKPVEAGLAMSQGCQVSNYLGFFLNGHLNMARDQEEGLVKPG